MPYRNGRTTSVQFDHETLGRLQQRAAERHVSVSAVVRWAVDHYLPPPPKNPEGAPPQTDESPERS